MTGGTNTIFKLSTTSLGLGVQGTGARRKKEAFCHFVLFFFVLHRAWQNSLFLDHTIWFSL